MWFGMYTVSCPAEGREGERRVRGGADGRGAVGGEGGQEEGVGGDGRQGLGGRRRDDDGDYCKEKWRSGGQLGPACCACRWGGGVAQGGAGRGRWSRRQRRRPVWCRALGPCVRAVGVEGWATRGGGVALSRTEEGKLRFGCAFGAGLGVLCSDGSWSDACAFC